MKRFTTVILAIAMLMSVCTFGISVAAEDSVAPSWEFKFDQESVVTGYTNSFSGKTTLSWDSTEEAMKITPVSGQKEASGIRITYSTKMKAEENSVIALVVKANGAMTPLVKTKTEPYDKNVNSECGTQYAKDNSGNGVTLGNTTNTVSTWDLDATPKTVDMGNGYVLLLADLWQTSRAVYAKKTDGDTTTYYPLIAKCKLASSNVFLLPTSTYSGDPSVDFFYLRSAAVFSNAADAIEYYGAKAQEHFVLSFDSASSVTANSSVVKYNDVAISENDYSEEKGGLYVEPDVSKAEETDIANLRIDASKLDIEPSMYPYIVAKIKLNKSSSTFGQIVSNTKASSYYKTICGGNTFNVAINGSYSQSTDWQYLKLDVKNAIPPTQSAPLEELPLTSHTAWNTLIFKLCKDKTSAEDLEGLGYCIEWIGFFQTEADAQMYDSAKRFGWQKSTEQTGFSNYDARIICTVDSNYEQYESAGIVINAKGSSQTLSLDKSTDVVYSSLLAMSDEGLKTVEAPDGKKFMALVITGIPLSEGDISMEITPYVVKDGAYYYGKTSSFTVSYNATAPVE